MDVSIYFYKEKVIIPSVVQTEAGFFLETEPVNVFSIEDSASIAQIIRSRFEAPNLIISTPPRDVLSRNPTPVVLAAGAKSWKDFFESAKLIKIMQAQSMFSFFRMEKTKAFSWKEPQNLKTAISESDGLNVIWQKIATTINKIP